MTSDEPRAPSKAASPGRSSADQPRPEPNAASLPPAGPHARPELMNPDATPGTGTLPPIGPAEDPNAQPTS
jgi:hypothetical protein